MTTSITDVYTFLDMSTELWSTSMGDPRSPTTTSVKFKGKLFGSYHWPFSFTFPSTIIVRCSSGETTTWHIPPSFSERLTRGHIQYQLFAHIRRGRLHVDSRLEPC